MKHVFLAAALLAGAAQPLAAPSALDASASPLEGLWVGESAIPVVHGALVVTRGANAWRARLGQTQMLASANGREITFALPDGQGGFRGAREGGVIRGFWTQPPGLAGQGYATPLTLHAGPANTWLGEVAPLEQSFHLYLRVFRDTDGSWLGAFRNPEANFTGGASRFLVTLAGDGAHFSVPGQGPSHDATFLRAPDRLRLPWPPLSGEIELRRASPAEAGAFQARPTSAGPYVYAPPPSTGDGWRTARANNTGMDEHALGALVQRIIDVDPSSRRPALIHSLLVAHRGRLVLEEYFHGFGRETPHDIRSAGKTFASVMLGAAMAQGLPISPQTRAYDLLAAMGPFANPDPRKAAITLAHLMTESSGLACNDYDEASPGAEGAMQSQTAQPNWWKFTLDLPVAHEPGERYAYCSGNINLMGAALATATGMPVVDYFDRAIARPLQFGPYHWNLMANGEGYLGGGVQMRPRDLLKIGQLYLNGGVWNGHRVISRAWAVLSTSALKPINEETTGLDADSFANAYTRGWDGYAWHRYGIALGDRTAEEYEANGNGGQLLIVVPEYDLVVVMTGGNFGQGGIWTRWRNEIVGGQIVPAIRR